MMDFVDLVTEVHVVDQTQSKLKDYQAFEVSACLVATPLVDAWEIQDAVEACYSASTSLPARGTHL